MTLIALQASVCTTSSGVAMALSLAQPRTCSMPERAMGWR